jgi:hypothetical protein
VPGCRISPERSFWYVCPTGTHRTIQPTGVLLVVAHATRAPTVHRTWLFENTVCVQSYGRTISKTNCSVPSVSRIAYKAKKRNVLTLQVVSYTRCVVILRILARPETKKKKKKVLDRTKPYDDNGKLYLFTASLCHLLRRKQYC